MSLTAAHYGFNYGNSGNESEVVSDTEFTDRVAPTGVGWVRLDVYWASVEPTQDNYDWNWVGIRDIQNAKAAGLKTYVTISRTPDWVGTGDAADVPDLDGWSHWRDFLAALKAQVGADIDVYGIWNEPNAPDFWNGTPQDYFDLFEEARAALGAVTMAGPEVADCDPADAGCDEAGDTFLSDFHSEMANRGVAVDVYSVHVYENSASAFEGRVQNFADQLDTGDELWVTEGARADRKTQTEIQQRDHLDRVWVKLSETTVSQWKKYIGYWRWYAPQGDDQNPEVRGTRAEDAATELMGQDTPTAPINVDATVQPGAEVFLEWQDVSGEDDFEVFRDWSLLATVDRNFEQYSDADVVAGETYEYAVRGVNDAGDGAFSDSKVVTV